MEDKSNFPYYLGIFLLSPALAFMVGIANFKKYSAKRILLFFFGAYGFTMIIIPSKDSYRFAESLYFFQDASFDKFLEIIWLMLTFQMNESGITEPFYAVVSFIVAQFTTDSGWLFLIVGLIFGFFYIKGVTLVLNETDNRWNLSIAVLFIFFVSWVSLNGINAPRNWTACWVFFCGAFLYLKTKNFKYLFLVLLAPLIHFAYWLITAPFFIYIVLKDRKYLYVVILAISFAVSTSTSFIKPYIATTEIGKSRVEAYIESDRWADGENEIPEDRSFHAAYYRLASDVTIQFLFITAILFFGYLKEKRHDKLLNGLAGISLLMLSLANIFTTIPVVNNRIFRNFGNFALAYLIILFFRNYEELKSKHWMINLCIPAILLFLFTQYSQFGDFMDFRILFSPLMYPFLGDDPVSIKAFLRDILTG